MSDDKKRKLQQQLWNIADTLRGKMGADEFRDYILGFIFYKYLSEKHTSFANNLLKSDGINFAEIDDTSKKNQEILEAIKEESVSNIGFYLKPSELFNKVAQKGKDKGFILDDLKKVLKNIGDSTMGTESEDDFIDLFEDLDLSSAKLGRSEEDKNELIANVLLHLNEIDFRLEDTESDVLGDAYEYMIGQFASGAGKKAGEFYTPQEVSKILAKLVTTGKKRLQSAYDPTCGSGSLLLRVAKEVDSVANFYGQEMNRTTFNLARMNMILHDVHYQKFDLRQEDTLERPQHLGEEFEAIVANPPFSAKWSAKPLYSTDDRFSQYGRLAPGSKADFAFIQHMLHHLAENGQMAVVLPHGVLFRGAAERVIRQYIIEKLNYLDAVIGLPANIFYGTSIPTSILVFKRCREHPEDILFIDASQGYEKAKNQNSLRESDIDKIIDTYRTRKPLEKYSHIAPMSEVIENEYNLNIPRYVDTFEEEEKVNLKAVAKQLVDLDKEMGNNNKTIANFCNELGIDVPFKI